MTPKQRANGPALAAGFQACNADTASRHASKQRQQGTSPIDGELDQPERASAQVFDFYVQRLLRPVLELLPCQGIFTVGGPHQAV